MRRRDPCRRVGLLALLLALCLLWTAAPGLAAGPRRVELPNLRGHTLHEAQRTLSNLGFDRVEVFGVPTDKRGLANRVQSQSPPAGAEVNTNTLIRLAVYEYDQ